MGTDDASSAEMRQPLRPRHGLDRFALDEASVDRLLTGTLTAASAPPGYARVAELLAATVAPPTPRELAVQAAVLAELRAVTRARSSAISTRPARPPRRRRAGLAVAVMVGSLATGGVAAATGHVPEPVRVAARSILAGPGGVPATPESPEPAPVTTTGSGGANLAGSPSTGAPGGRPGSAAAGSVAGPNLEGLCRAFLAGNGGEGQKLGATAFAALSRAAGGDDEVLDFCQRLLPPDAKQKKPKEPKQQNPPGDEDHGQGGPPATTGGGQGSPPATPSPSAADPSGNDGSATLR
jgi:hypothetical protein